MNSSTAENKNAKKIRNIFRNQLGIIITVFLAAAILLAVYFAVIKPLTDDDDKTPVGNSVRLIWKSEIPYATNSMLLYEHIDSNTIQSIDIHNPNNAEKYGEQYVDWGIYRFKGEDPDGNLNDGTLYFKDYEFAPSDPTRLVYLTNACGFAVSNSRIEDHCTDYSRYGLDYKNDEEAIYFVVTKTDGASYKVYIGDRLPSGVGYYIRVVGKDISLETGEEMERDSVYVSNSLLEDTVLTCPQNLTTPYLTYPVDPNISSTFDYFMFIDHELDRTISFLPIKSQKDPFMVFKGLSIYYAVSPEGYFSSTSFEGVFSLFQDLQGTQVLELATPQISKEDGEEYLGFDDEILNKYFPDGGRYSVTFRHAGVDNDILISSLQENSYYYVYSMVMNTIVKVSYETIYFLSWEPETFIGREVVNLNIDSCESITIEGIYKDLGIDFPGREGVQNVNETFRLDGTVRGLTVTAMNAGKTVNTDNFRQLFRQLISMYVREELDEDQVKEALKGDPMATIEVVTREKTVYKTDENGKDTAEVDYTVASVTRIFRFYRLTNDKCLVTTESIDEDGISTGENGSFYIMTARVEQILSGTISVLEDITINGNDRY